MEFFYSFPKDLGCEWVKNDLSFFFNELDACPLLNTKLAPEDNGNYYLPFLCSMYLDNSYHNKKYNIFNKYYLLTDSRLRCIITVQRIKSENTMSALAIPRARFDLDFRWLERPAPDLLPTGIAELDAVTGGFPRGALTGIYGPASSGRTSLLLSLLAEATRRQEFCALVDATDSFDPASAHAAGVDLSRLLWIRCAGNAEHALKATDLLVASGGFGLVAMDLGDVAPQTARRISLASWFRLRRVVEHTPTVLVALEREPNAKTCASLALDLRGVRIHWSGAPGCSHLLRGLSCVAERLKPVGSHSGVMHVRLHSYNVG